MSDSGKYVLSSHKGQGKRRFDKEFRESFVNVPAKITKSTIIFIKLPDLADTVSHQNLVSMIN